MSEKESTPEAQKFLNQLHDEWAREDRLIKLNLQDAEPLIDAWILTGYEPLKASIRAEVDLAWGAEAEIKFCNSNEAAQREVVIAHPNGRGIIFVSDRVT